jgi:hypothetical protein
VRPYFLKAVSGKMTLLWILGGAGLVGEVCWWARCLAGAAARRAAAVAASTGRAPRAVRRGSSAWSLRFLDVSIDSLVSYLPVFHHARCLFVRCLLVQTESWPRRRLKASGKTTAMRVDVN